MEYAARSSKAGIGAKERVTPQAVRDQNPGRARSRASMASLITFSVDKCTFLPAGLGFGSGNRRIIPADYSGVVESVINSRESAMAPGSKTRAIILSTAATGAAFKA